MRILPIKGYKGLYEISDTGRVFSCERFYITKNRWGEYVRMHKRKELSPEIERRGYYRVALCKNGKATHKLVSHLVAEAFVPNPHNYSKVLHKDNNKLNNNWDNLEWGTLSKNTQDAYETGVMDKRGEKHHRAILTNENIFEIRTSSLSRRELAIKFKISYDAITSVILRRTWKHI